METVGVKLSMATDCVVCLNIIDIDGKEIIALFRQLIGCKCPRNRSAHDAKYARDSSSYP